MEIEGHWLAAGRSTRRRARLQLNQEGYTLLIQPVADQTDPAEHSVEATADEWHTQLFGTATDLDVSPRLGNIPRNLTLTDGSVFATQDNASIDAWLLGQRRQAVAGGILHRLESSWRWAGLSLVLLVCFAYGTVFYAIPWSSKALAAKLPPEFVLSVSERTLALMDKGYLRQSTLALAKQRQLSQHFNELLAAVKKINPQVANSAPAGEYRLIFRQMGAANAFALPDGTIVMTDGFVKLAQHQNEIDAVLLHELGHVLYQHGLQQAVRSLLITVGIALIIGDPSGLEELLIALPSLLLQSQYSRLFETEADEFSLQSLSDLGIDPINFANIMRLLDPPDEDAADSDDDSVFDYLSSHPISSARIERAQQMSELFRAGEE